MWASKPVLMRRASTEFWALRLGLGNGFGESGTLGLGVGVLTLRSAFDDLNVVISYRMQYISCFNHLGGLLANVGCGGSCLLCCCGAFGRSGWRKLLGSVCMFLVWASNYVLDSWVTTKVHLLLL